ncbi:MAG: hypothetical protein ABIK15_09590 [Pseudomonadota bacterium]
MVRFAVIPDLIRHSESSTPVIPKKFPLDDPKRNSPIEGGAGGCHPLPANHTNFFNPPFKTSNTVMPDLIRYPAL